MWADPELALVSSRVADFLRPMQVSKGQNICDVVVISAGVYGVWIAYELQRSGKRVILIDAHGTGHSRSSSGGESGGIVMPRRAAQAVARSAINNGAEDLQGAVQPPNGEGRLTDITTTNGERILAATYVFACAPRLPKMFPALLADRIHPTRQQVFF